MFQESEHRKGEYFEMLHRVGATTPNGTTNSDRTNYFQNVPTTALDFILWMESDRMGHLLGAIDQAGLDEQRAVVKNEKRLRENRAYGRVNELLLAATYPKDHPYHRTPIGFMADLDEATVTDVKNWFKSWYGPNNAVLVLAGDIDLATAKDKVARYFGHIPASATVKKLPPQIAARTKTTRETVTDRVPQTRIYRVWNIPGIASDDAQRLQMLSFVLGGSRASRLDRRLAHQDKLVDSVSAYVVATELGGRFFIQADVKAGGDPAVVEKVIDEELRALIAKGPTPEELANARSYRQAELVRGLEPIGGFGGKSDILAKCAVLSGNVHCYERQYDAMMTTTIPQLRALGRTWLSKGDHVLTIAPGPLTPVVEPAAIANLPPTKIAPPDKRFTTTPFDVDRSNGPPMPTAYPPTVFPKLTRATLPNGVAVVLAERRGLPLVQMSLEFRGAGSSSDPATKPGLASFAMGMLDEGAGQLTALQIGDKVEALGMRLETAARLDSATIGLSTITPNLEPALALLADLVLRPTLDANELERVRLTHLARLRQDKAQPDTVTFRVGPLLVFGPGHPYGTLATGTEASITALTRAELVDWTKARLRPDRATLLVVGDTSLAELVPKLTAAFGAWTAPAGPAATPIPAIVKLPAKPRVFLVDQPGATQSSFWISHPVQSSSDPQSADFDMASLVLGGEFGSRLNMNLRERKQWTYSALAFADDALGPRLWHAHTSIQTDKTVDAMKELDREIRDLATGKVPATPDEIVKMQAVEIRTLPGWFETAQSVLTAVGGIVRYNRPDDYWVRHATRVANLKSADINAMAKHIKPDALTWVIVGDLAKIEKPIRELRLGEVKIIDADGKILR